MQTFYWHDYETFGTQLAIDQYPAEFAGLRTDLDLNPAGEETDIYCKPIPDMLPSPDACLVTGITPLGRGERETEEFIEAEFAGKVNEELSRPGTIGVGYNNFHFDDEVTRFLLYRNFLPPYERESRMGRGRWDLYPLTLAAWSLETEGVEWPLKTDFPEFYGKGPNGEEPQGRAFKLECLTKWNGIEHEAAHNALSDVKATIKFARLLKKGNPDLWNWALAHRAKDAVRRILLDGPVFLVSQYLGEARGYLMCGRMIGGNPGRSNEVLLWDLSRDPDELHGMDPSQFAERLAARFRRREEENDGAVPGRLPVQTVKLNQSPLVFPAWCLLGDGWPGLSRRDKDQLQRIIGLKTLERRGLDVKALDENARKLEGMLDEVDGLVRNALGSGARDADRASEPDADAMLYKGGFPSYEDGKTIAWVASTSPAELAGRCAAGKVNFENPLYGELLLRYRARNFPETLSEADAERWRGIARKRIELRLPSFAAALDDCRNREYDGKDKEKREKRRNEILSSLEAWKREVTELFQVDEEKALAAAPVERRVPAREIHPAAAESGPPRCGVAGRCASSPAPTFYWFSCGTLASKGPERWMLTEFAGARTDLDLRTVERGMDLNCKPLPDALPSPALCLLGGLTPQDLARRGLPEAEFARRAASQVLRPGTVAVCFNNPRRDDEAACRLLWRNFLLPLGGGPGGGCAMWDLLPVTLAFWSLRPDGVKWPLKKDFPQIYRKRADGAEPAGHSFRLECLMAGNGIACGGPTPAVANVRALVFLARLLRKSQPKFWDWAVSHRDPEAVRQELARGPVVVVSPRFGEARGFLACCQFLGFNPGDRDEAILWDLSHDPARLLGMDPGELSSLLASARESRRATGLPVVPVRVDRPPFVCSALGVVPRERWEGLGLSAASARAAAGVVEAGAGRVASLLAEAFERDSLGLPGSDGDADLAGPGGLNLSGDDVRAASSVATLSGDEIAERSARGLLGFACPALRTLLLRYRARNFPGTLEEAEEAEWRRDAASRLAPRLAAYAEALDNLGDRLMADEDAWSEDAERALGDLHEWLDAVSSLADADSSGFSGQGA